MAHLHLGLLAYWVVNMVRYQLKGGQAKETVHAKVAETAATEHIQKTQENNIQDVAINYNSQWKEIIRIMNTQKAVTTVSQNRYDQVIISHRCSEPTPKVDAIYRRLKYKPEPNTIRKFVVHKVEYEKMDNIDIYLFPT